MSSGAGPVQVSAVRQSRGAGAFLPGFGGRLTSWGVGGHYIGRRRPGVEPAKAARPWRRGLCGARGDHPAFRAGDTPQWSFSAAGGPGSATRRRGHEGGIQTCRVIRGGRDRTSSPYPSAPNRSWSERPSCPRTGQPQWLSSLRRRWLQARWNHQLPSNVPDTEPSAPVASATPTTPAPPATP